MHRAPLQTENQRIMVKHTEIITSIEQEHYSKTQIDHNQY